MTLISSFLGFKCQMSAHLLCFSFVRSLVLMIDPREVGDDDGDGEGDHEHAGQGADAADDLTQAGVRHHVAVPEICL